MSKYDYKPIIPTAAGMVTLVSCILCVSHIGTSTLVTVVGILFVLLSVSSVAAYVWLVRKGLRYSNLLQRVRSIRKLLPLRIVRVLCMIGALYLWITPTLYTKDRFEQVLNVFELGAVENTIHVFEPVIPAPAKDAIQYAGELILFIDSVASNITVLQAETEGMTEAETRAYVDAYFNGLGIDMQRIQDTCDSLDVRTNLLIVLVVVDLALSNIITLIGTIRYKRQLRVATGGVHA